MSGSYRLELDEAARMIIIKGSGFFDVDTFRRFRTEAYDAVMHFNGGHLSYADFTECTVQHQDIIALAQGLFLNSPAKAKRVAIVVKGVLQERQTSRILVREGMEVFNDCDEAMYWLKSGEEMSRIPAV
jgi:hypothetical protein